MSTKSPAFQFYVRDWMCSLTVKRMTGPEVKAYLYLLCAAWLETPRATLPNDDFELSSFANVSENEWVQLKPGVMRGFKLVNDRWINDRLKLVSDAQDRHRIKSLKGGNPKFKKSLPVHLPSSLPN